MKENAGKTYYSAEHTREQNAKQTKTYSTSNLKVTGAAFNLDSDEYKELYFKGNHYDLLHTKPGIFQSPIIGSLEQVNVDNCELLETIILLNSVANFNYCCIYLLMVIGYSIKFITYNKQEINYAT